MYQDKLIQLPQAQQGKKIKMISKQQLKVIENEISIKLSSTKIHKIVEEGIILETNEYPTSDNISCFNSSAFHNLDDSLFMEDKYIEKTSKVIVSLP